MLMAGIGKETLHIVSHLLRREFRVGRGQGEYLMPESLHGAGLVHVDVCHVCGNDALARSEQRVDHRSVGLCAADEEVDFSVTHLAGVPDLFLSLLAVGVVAVATGLLVIGVEEAVQDFGLHAIVIIAFKRNHIAY